VDLWRFVLLVYLVRHGIAKSNIEDSERALTRDGEAEIETIGVALKKRGVSVDNIFHSPKKRAFQTAHIIGATVAPGLTPEISDGLLPEDDPEQWLDRLENMDCDTMLVGHLPYMGILTSLLRCGDENNALEEFTPGTVVCLRKTDDCFTLEWKISPRRI
jgi:phosphohistidine phosphatase